MPRSVSVGAVSGGFTRRRWIVLDPPADAKYSPAGDGVPYVCAGWIAYSQLRLRKAVTVPRLGVEAISGALSMAKMLSQQMANQTESRKLWKCRGGFGRGCSLR